MKKIEREIRKLNSDISKALLDVEESVTLEFARRTLELEEELDRLYQKLASKEGQIHFDDLLKYNRLNKLDNNIADIISTAYDNSDKIIRAHLRRSTMLSYQGTIRTARGATRRSLKAVYTQRDVTKTINERMAGLRWAERTRFHRNGTIAEVQKAVKEGIDNGQTYTEMSRSLTKRLDGEVLKPIRIVRTETQRVENNAKLEALEDLESQGVKMKKRWLSSRDERTRSAHADLDGMTIPLDEDFHSGIGGVGPAPGMMGLAGDDINCRCLLTMVLD